MRVGDAVTYELGMQPLRNEVAVARAFDNKVGAWVVAEALRRIDAQKCAAEVVSVATVQEELGLRGAITSTFGIDPLVGVAVDVTHATDHPNVNKVTAGDVSLDGGPVITRGANVNPVVERLLMESAEALEMKVQIEAEPRGTGTDANAMQLSRAGVATGLVSVPLRYMHTPSEVISLEVANQAADLLAAFAERLTPDIDFTPKYDFALVHGKRNCRQSLQLEFPEAWAAETPDFSIDRTRVGACCPWAAFASPPTRRASPMTPVQHAPGVTKPLTPRNPSRAAAISSGRSAPMASTGKRVRAQPPDPSQSSVQSR